MESDPNIMPDMRPHYVRRTGEFLKRVWNLGRVVEPCLSEHIREPSEYTKEPNEQLTLEFGE